MSQSYNVTKKHNRRALDAANPERKRIRRMIRSGKLPVRAFNKNKDGRPIMRVAEVRGGKDPRRMLYLQP